MSMGDYTILYVDDLAATRAFYGAILKREPVEDGAAFVLYSLDTGAKLGLWARETVLPPAGPNGGLSGECCFCVADEAAVDRIHDDLKAGGAPIAQEPTRMDFGYTLVTLDPDGHRLRVFASAMTSAA